MAMANSGRLSGVGGPRLPVAMDTGIAAPRGRMIPCGRQGRGATAIALPIGGAGVPSVACNGGWRVRVSVAKRGARRLSLEWNEARATPQPWLWRGKRSLWGLDGSQGTAPAMVA